MKKLRWVQSCKIAYKIARTLLKLGFLRHFFMQIINREQHNFLYNLVLISICKFFIDYKLHSPYGMMQFCCLWKIYLFFLTLNCTWNRVITKTLWVDLASLLCATWSIWIIRNICVLLNLKWWFISSVIFRVQSLFSWRPGEMANPKSSFFSFKAIVQNPKMKVILLCL